MAVTGSLSVSWNFRETSTSNTTGTTINDGSLPITLSFASGTGSGQADQHFLNSFTLASGATNNHDISGGLTSALGATITAAKHVALIIYNPATVAGDYLSVGAHATNPLISFINAAGVNYVRPGGFLVWSCFVDAGTVTAATGDLLKVTNSGANSITYTIGFLTKSA